MDVPTIWEQAFWDRLLKPGKPTRLPPPPSGRRFKVPLPREVAPGNTCTWCGQASKVRHTWIWTNEPGFVIAREGYYCPACIAHRGEVPTTTLRRMGT